MMGKQFSILATDVDLQVLDEKLRATEDVEILSDIVTDDLRDLLPLNSLRIPQSAVGKASLFCYLAPRHIPKMIVAKRHSHVKVRVELRESHLIEFWRPYYDTHIMRNGRFFYESRVLRDGQFFDRDPEFHRWADGIMKKVRSMLKFHKELGAYVGAHAAEEIASGRLNVVT